MLKNKIEILILHLLKFYRQNYPQYRPTTSKI